MVPDDDQAIVLPWASVMVIMVLLNVAFTCATPEEMFLRSRRRTRVASLPILSIPSTPPALQARTRGALDVMPVKARLAYFFLPAIGRAGPLRVRALV